MTPACPCPCHKPGHSMKHAQPCCGDAGVTRAAGDLIAVTDGLGFVTLHEPDEEGNAGDLVASVWRDDWLPALQSAETPLKVLNTDDARLAVWKAIKAITIGNPTDDKLIVRNLAIQGVSLALQPAAQGDAAGPGA